MPVYGRHPVFSREYSISRVLFRISGSNHLSGLAVTCKLKRLNPEGSAGRIIPSLFGLAPRGVYQASQSPDCWCALTAPFHPYRLPGGFLFYDTFPKVTLAGRYPARCPVEPGLSSNASRTSAIAFRTRKYIFYSFWQYLATILQITLKKSLSESSATTSTFLPPCTFLSASVR